MSCSPVALSSIHTNHIKLGAVMEEVEGWYLPVRYGSSDTEMEQARKSVGIADMSPIGKFFVEGTTVDTFLEEIFREPSVLDVGSSRRVSLGDERSGVEVNVARLMVDELLISTESRDCEDVSNFLGGRLDRCLHVTNVTSGFSVIRVIGPQGLSLLENVTELDLSTPVFPDKSCAQTRLADVHCTILRVDLGRLLAYDLYVAREYGEHVWSFLYEVGETFDLTPVGMEAIHKLNDG